MKDFIIKMAIGAFVMVILFSIAWVISLINPSFNFVASFAGLILLIGLCWLIGATVKEEYEAYKYRGRL